MWLVHKADGVKNPKRQEKNSELAATEVIKGKASREYYTVIIDIVKISVRYRDQKNTDITEVC